MGLCWWWLSALCYSNHFLPWAKTWLTHNLTRCHHLFTMTLFMRFRRHILFSFRWSWNEFGNRINKYGNDEKMSNPPANWDKKYIPPALTSFPAAAALFFLKIMSGCFRGSGRLSQGRHAVGFLLTHQLHGGRSTIGYFVRVSGWRSPHINLTIIYQKS